ncbi:hypothetical protein O0I10_006201 [Lichtheimia ornata]|uniref:Uncharacterized protein n=1 Tax=Lichtheimia ornata TaxID=688661 RepID=A0AAD7XZ37_9FUNG|nr:uncharacterized protein O0I10_006201 [Lichtheimia ornata]KAJ8658193.1 hypothetical protein O0I10_006201 [Lichtheimia ornata]
MLKSALECDLYKGLIWIPPTPKIAERNTRPHSTNKTTTPSEEKYMHYKALAKELQDIDTNIKKLHQNFQQTSNLSDSFRRLETVHSSMFMGASTIFKDSKHQQQQQQQLPR